MKSAFTDLKLRIERFEADLTLPRQFNHQVMRWTIQGLLDSDLLTDEKRIVLKDFLRNDLILSEIAGVLNMRMATLSAWSWGPEVNLEERMQTTGVYSLYYQEELVQAIFLQYVGMKWCVFLKDALKEFREAEGVWQSNQMRVPENSHAAREYFMGRQTRGGLQARRFNMYLKDYFVAQLPSSLGEKRHHDQGGRETEAVAKEKHKKPMELKQDLLHLVATEIEINKHIHGKITVFRSGFEQWYLRLPHQTVLQVLESFGLSDKWVGFFKTFLQVPLKFIDETVEPRTRKCGIPPSHAISDFLGELILFCLDFAINQEFDGSLLWRVQDEFWFWSVDQEVCVKAWKLIDKFKYVMGVSLNPAKTGTVCVRENPYRIGRISTLLPKGNIRWGFLNLDAATGRFEVDQEAIGHHIKELDGQLRNKKSILGWIQTWNSYATTFVTNFGKPAVCHGNYHVDRILDTHKRIQQELFAGGGVTQYLENEVKNRFNVDSIPDGFFFFPTELGGLNLQDPSISLLQIRNSDMRPPADIFDDFFENERSYYYAAEQQFDRGSIKRYRSAGPPWRQKAVNNEFFPFEEFTKYREEYNVNRSASLCEVFDELLRRPTQVSTVARSPEVESALHGLRGYPLLKCILPYFDRMDAYWKWIAQMYGPEMIKRFGDLSIVDPALLPTGMVSVFQDKRMVWSE